MRELLIGQREQIDTAGRPLTCAYSVLVRDVPPPVSCESYGVGITVLESGEREEVLDLTVRPERIHILAQSLLQGGVTPCALREVVEDWL